MIYSLRVSERADQDLSAILETIAQGGGENALKKYLDRLDKFYDLIVERPEICALRPRLGKFVRVAVVYPYLVIYRHARGEGVVEIVRIVHGRRKLTRRGLL